MHTLIKRIYTLHGWIVTRETSHVDNSAYSLSYRAVLQTSNVTSSKVQNETYICFPTQWTSNSPFEF